MSNAPIAAPKDIDCHSIGAQNRQCYPFPSENEKNPNKMHHDSRIMAGNSWEMRPWHCCSMIMECMKFHSVHYFLPRLVSWIG